MLSIRYRIQPVCKMPRCDLPPDDSDMLQELLSGQLEYMFHNSFRKRGACAELFGKDQLGGRASRFPPAPALDVVYDDTLFLRFNFARFRVVQLVESRGKGYLTMSCARAILAWHRRALEARDKIAEENYNLVLSMAHRHKPPVLDYDEAISDGSVALLNCIRGFDCSRGKFSTYACRSIRKSFARAAARAGRRRAMFPAEFDPVMACCRTVDPRKESAIVEDTDDINTILEKNLANLNDRERLVIDERFGSRKLTLEQVGRIIGVTKERVRQIQATALLKLRDAYEATL